MLVRSRVTELPPPSSAMTSSASPTTRYRTVSDSQPDDDDDVDYALTGTGNGCGSYESFGTCDFLLDDSDQSSATCSSGSLMTKSKSMPSHVADAAITSTSLPDPFPELSWQKTAPLAASRLYSSIDVEPRCPPSPPHETETSPALSSSSAAVVVHLGDDYSRMSADCYVAAADDDDDAVAEMSITFFNDDHSSHSLTVDTRTTVAQCCDRLVHSNHALHSPHWTVVERLGRHHLERGIEHHELICQIHKTWTPDDEGRFYFRRDFSKYELFRNPTQFFPEHMVETKISPKDDSSGILTRSERYKNLLLQNLLANQCIPDIQGYVHVREGKRSWKKYFCVLRGSGFYYSTKGCQKEPQYLSLISALDDVNIFTALNAKKDFNAPTNYGFCLRPSRGLSDVRHYKLFAVDNDQARLCWITGMRFVKYGAQLRENLRLTLKCDDPSSTSENGAESNKLNSSALYVKSRVAMDFSGERGRVVADPNEALGVAFEEGYNWRKKAALRNSSGLSHSPRSSGDNAVDPALNLMPPRPCPMTAIHTTQPWFHGHISRDAAVSLLAEQGLVDGLFLVRNSQSIPNVFVLSFVHNQKVKHCTIRKMDVDGLIYYSLDGGTTKFMDLIQLVDFYQLNAGALPTQLNYYVTRLL